VLVLKGLNGNDAVNHGINAAHLQCFAQVTKKDMGKYAENNMPNQWAVCRTMAMDEPGLWIGKCQQRSTNFGMTDDFHLPRIVYGEVVARSP